MQFQFVYETGNRVRDSGRHETAWRGGFRLSKLAPSRTKEKSLGYICLTYFIKSFNIRVFLYSNFRIFEFRFVLRGVGFFIWDFIIHHFWIWFLLYIHTKISITPFYDSILWHWFPTRSIKHISLYVQSFIFIAKIKL